MLRLDKVHLNAKKLDRFGQIRYDKVVLDAQVTLDEVRLNAKIVSVNCQV